MTTNQLPSIDLLSTYKQYKADTESIAGWLTETSIKCGYELPLPPSGRLKGKARKEAKMASSSTSTPANPSNSSPPSPPKCTIRVADFVPMAKTIAECNKPKVSIPDALHNLFEQAIEARHKFNEYYKGIRVRHGNRESIKRHLHFVGVLKTTWNTLRPSNADQRQATQPPETDGASNPFPSILRNRFAGLQIKDLDHVPDATEGEKNPSPSSSAPASASGDPYRLPENGPAAIIRDEDDIEADFFFAVLSFCLEIMQVRAFTQRIWASYRKGGMELIQATLLTNTAILLVRQAENELEGIIERPRAYPASKYPVWTLPGIILWHEHDLVDQNVRMDDYVKVSAELFTINCEHGELFFWDAFNALKACAHHITRRPKNVILHDLSSAYRSISDTQRRIFRLFPLFQLTTLALPRDQGNEEVSRAIRTICESQTIPIWAAFSIQALLDIQDELADEPRKAVEELQQHTREAVGEFRAVRTEDFQFLYDRKPIEYLKGVLGTLEDIALKDKYGRNLKVISQRDPTQYTGSEPDAFLRQNPLRCGMLKYDLYLQLHKHALEHEGKSRWLTNMMHVYVACRSVYPDDPVWPDMEWVLRRQDKNHLFSGGVPQSMAEALEKFLLGLGVEASSFMSNENNPPEYLEFDPRQTRRVSNRSVLAGCFEEWMDGSGSTSDDAGVTDVEGWVANLTMRIHDPAALTSTAQLFGMSESRISALRTQWGQSRRSIPEICNTLAYWFQNESVDLFTNWLSMFSTCEDLWRQIAVFAAAAMEGGGSAARFEIPEDLVPGILAQAREVEARAVETEQEDRNTFVRDHATLLAGAWRIMKAAFTAQDVVYNGVSDLPRKCSRGDILLLKLARMFCEQSPQCLVQVGIVQKELYKHWSEAYTGRSAVWMYLYTSHLFMQDMSNDSMLYMPR